MTHWRQRFPRPESGSKHVTMTSALQELHTDRTARYPNRGVKGECDVNCEEGRGSDVDWPELWTSKMCASSQPWCWTYGLKTVNCLGPTLQLYS